MRFLRRKNRRKGVALRGKKSTGDSFRKAGSPPSGDSLRKAGSPPSGDSFRKAGSPPSGDSFRKARSPSSGDSFRKAGCFPSGDGHPGKEWRPFLPESDEDLLMGLLQSLCSEQYVRNIRPSETAVLLNAADRYKN